jgi:hypothetical protein
MKRVLECIMFIVWCVHLLKGKKIIVGPKLNNLLKHQGHHKAKVSMFGVDDGSFYFNKDYVHAKNEWCYTSTNYPFVLD